MLVQLPALLVATLSHSAVAGTVLAPPGTLTEQIAEADLVGQFEVTEFETGLLDESEITLTFVTLTPVGSLLRGEAESVQVVFRGYHVDEVPIPYGSASLLVGDRVFALLNETHHTGIYKWSHGYTNGLYIRSRLEGVATTTDGGGNAVLDLGCEDNPVRAHEGGSEAVAADSAEPDRSESSAEELATSDDPYADAIEWADAVLALSRCGGE